MVLHFVLKRIQICVSMDFHSKIYVVQGPNILVMGNLSQKEFTFYHKFSISSMLKCNLDRNIFGIFFVFFLVSVIHKTVFNFAWESKKERKKGRKEERKKKSLSCVQLIQPTRLLDPWDFLGKSTGVSCHVLLQGISQPRDQTQVSHIVARHFTI